MHSITLNQNWKIVRVTLDPPQKGPSRKGKKPITLGITLYLLNLQIIIFHRSPGRLRNCVFSDLDHYLNLKILIYKLFVHTPEARMIKAILWPTALLLAGGAVASAMEFAQFTDEFYKVDVTKVTAAAENLAKEASKAAESVSQTVAREMQATPKPREIGFKSKQDLLREAREKAAGK